MISYVTFSYLLKTFAKSILCRNKMSLSLIIQHILYRQILYNFEVIRAYLYNVINPLYNVLYS